MPKSVLAALHDLMSVPVAAAPALAQKESSDLAIAAVGAPALPPMGKYPAASVPVELAEARPAGSSTIKAARPARPAEGEKKLLKTPTPPVQTVGVFITSESLVAFPVASTAVVVIWKVLGSVFPAWGTSRLVPFITAFITGALIYYISLPENAPRRMKIVGAGIGILNSFFLVATALGIKTVSTP